MAARAMGSPSPPSSCRPSSSLSSPLWGQPRAAPRSVEKPLGRAPPTCPRAQDVVGRGAAAVVKPVRVVAMGHGELPVPQVRGQGREHQRHAPTGSVRRHCLQVAAQDRRPVRPGLRRALAPGVRTAPPRPGQPPQTRAALQPGLPPARRGHLVVVAARHHHEVRIQEPGLLQDRADPVGVACAAAQVDHLVGGARIAGLQDLFEPPRQRQRRGRRRAGVAVGRAQGEGSPHQQHPHHIALVSRHVQARQVQLCVGGGPGPLPDPVARPEPEQLPLHEPGAIPRHQGVDEAEFLEGEGRRVAEQDEDQGRHTRVQQQPGKRATVHRRHLAS